MIKNDYRTKLGILFLAILVLQIGFVSATKYITNCSDLTLMDISASCTSYPYIMTEDVEMSNDVDCSGYTFTQVFEDYGTNGHCQYFGANFIGNNYTISNLYIEIGGQRPAPFGKFYNNANVTDLNFRNITILHTDTSYAGVSCFMSDLYDYGRLENINMDGCTIYNATSSNGGLVGSGNGHTEIKNVHVSNVYITRGGDEVGGIIGENGGLIIDSSVENITVIGATGSTGGLAGGQWYDGSDFVGNITNCYVKNVYFEGTDDYGFGGFIGEQDGYVSNSYVENVFINGTRVGGFVGYNWVSEIDPSENQFNNNYVKNATLIGTQYSGGFAGYSEGNIINSYVEKLNLAVSGASNQYTGGFVGQTNSLIQNCSASGTISVTDNYVGGLVGYFSTSTIKESWANVNITSSTGDSIGGLVGYNAGGNIEKSYALGNIFGTSSTTGGLVGDFDGGVMSECYVKGSQIEGSDLVGGIASYLHNSGVINNSYIQDSSVTGDQWVGGILGIIEDSTVINSYSTAEIINSTSNDIGGAIGLEDGTLSTVTNTFWDIETSGISISAYGDGKTTTEMQNQSTFTNWDFVNIWQIDEGTSYPYFLWQPPVEPVAPITVIFSTEESMINPPFSPIIPPTSSPPLVI